MAAPQVHLPMPTPQVHLPASTPHGPMGPTLLGHHAPVEPDAGRGPEAPKRSLRRSSERPSLPFASPVADRAGAPPTAESSRPSNPHLAMTIIGPPPATAPHGSELPRLVASDEISQVSDIGARPLVNDPKLGWETAVKLVAPDGGHTRLASEPVDLRLRSGATWIVLAIMFALAVVVVVAVLQS
jgi:hypothetical protein